MLLLVCSSPGGERERGLGESSRPLGPRSPPTASPPQSPERSRRGRRGAGGGRGQGNTQFTRERLDFIFRWGRHSASLHTRRTRDFAETPPAAQPAACAAWLASCSPCSAGLQRCAGVKETSVVQAFLQNYLCLCALLRPDETYKLRELLDC